MSRRDREALVRADGLLVGYTGEPVSPPTSFRLDPGRALALVGLNGAGKTTVLRAVLGQLLPIGGSLEVLGRAVDERSVAFRRDVASVLDVDAHFPGLTVREHLDLVARGHGVRDADDVVDQVVADLGLAPVGEREPASLSSGQRRRMLLAAAFVRPRRLLVLDEPEQRLDLAGREDVVDRLLEEKEAGVGVLLATHDPLLLEEVADRVLLLAEDGVHAVSAAEATRELGR
ncbi:ABC transporter ATP-binding protein [uncultured Pseudokineococcus sp.]|uniref:ABC transporter ATP-binding protein n=1 Tax=uncultured Pseudokineococcus sp. TaxID=1642928 RepID=UPI002636B926|nr:ABC transporter ATP-binding protein [uncultured Pseudokineococcus sp.]